ncbi:MAG: hypothetical protein UW86_C0001G0021 [Microgenomates group bacterium GW2011_GWA1_Microgenomates_45_10]|nr:MAG: hypothetical protein UW69_C0003G0023 [Microgenomates group bacterium GW2011_GWA2_44_7]KKT87468.1 MAG: hypothetical protein UW86_C0001G0021 [Microgenomates group bacterium GW2011_GWA1_Microgenomates_45_10]
MNLPNLNKQQRTFYIHKIELDRRSGEDSVFNSNLLSSQIAQNNPVREKRQTFFDHLLMVLFSRTE